MITNRQIDDWSRDGFLHVPGFLRDAALDEVLEVVDEIGRRADGDRELIQHYELTEHGVQICRSEHLIEGHPVLRSLLTDGTMQEMAGSLLGEPAVLYKEKINYKLPGGAGFAPHQDAPAYPFIDVHTTCMVALDDSTIDNGCLEVVSGRHGEVLPMDDEGCIRDHLVEDMTWTPVPVAAGDLLWFHSRAPHRSGANTSILRRRAMFCTYNAASQGDLRDAYYAEKLAVFANSAAGERTRVSLIGDFQGAAPSPEQIREHERRLAEGS
ncbi:MAG: hypothetical protein RLZZ01_899 [Actinomycetota bacterium]|jgi:hypothetical protein